MIKNPNRFFYNVQDIFYVFRTRVLLEKQKIVKCLLKVVSSHFYFWLTPHYYRENETLYTKLPGENLNLKHHILTTTTKQKQRDFDLLVRHLVITSCDDFSKNVQFGEVGTYLLLRHTCACTHLWLHYYSILSLLWLYVSSLENLIIVILPCGGHVKLSSTL